MKITETEQNIRTILNVYRGSIPPRHIDCRSRHSDCFVYVLTGQAAYTFDGIQCTAQSGDIIYLSRGSWYTIDVAVDNYTFYYLDFLFDNAGKPFDNEIYQSKNLVSLLQDFEKMHRLWTLGDFADKLSCRSLVYRIYSEVVRAKLFQYVSRDRKLQMMDAAHYMEENLADSGFRIAALGMRYQISEVHFRRLFYRVYRQTPASFLTMLRIKRAKELLASASCSIGDISEKCGFQNHYYFSKVFKASAGITPSEYRRSCGQELPPPTA